MTEKSQDAVSPACYSEGLYSISLGAELTLNLPSIDLVLLSPHLSLREKAARLAFFFEQPLPKKIEPSSNAVTLPLARRFPLPSKGNRRANQLYLHDDPPGHRRPLILLAQDQFRPRWPLFGLAGIFIRQLFHGTGFHVLALDSQSADTEERCKSYLAIAKAVAESPTLSQHVSSLHLLACGVSGHAALLAAGDPSPGFTSALIISPRPVRSNFRFFSGLRSSLKREREFRELRRRSSVPTLIIASRDDRGAFRSGSTTPFRSFHRLGPESAPTILLGRGARATQGIVYGWGPLLKITSSFFSTSFVLP